jgi:hypothetical protein
LKETKFWINWSFSLPFSRSCLCVAGSYAVPRFFLNARALLSCTLCLLLSYVSRLCILSCMVRRQPGDVTYQK